MSITTKTSDYTPKITDLLWGTAMMQKHALMDLPDFHMGLPKTHYITYPVHVHVHCTTKSMDLVLYAVYEWASNLSQLLYLEKAEMQQN